MKELIYRKQMISYFKALWVWDFCYQAYKKPTISELKNRYPNSDYINIWQDETDYMFVIRYAVDDFSYMFFVFSGTLLNIYPLDIYPLVNGMLPEGLYAANQDIMPFIRKMIDKYPNDIKVFTGHSRGSWHAAVTTYFLARNIVKSEYIGFGTPTVGTREFALQYNGHINCGLINPCVRVNTRGDIINTTWLNNIVWGQHIGTEILLPGGWLGRWRIFSRIFRHTPRKYDRVIKGQLKKFKLKPKY